MFYRTLPIDPSSPRGSDLRPAKLLQAFRDLGYEVDLVDGPAAARKAAMEAVKERIRSGVEYDFLYAEPPTTPIPLNEPNHLPTHPLLDYSFLSFCHGRGVPVILFYCDVQWRLPRYPAQVGWPKYLAALPFFHLDLAVYRRAVDVLVLPDEGMLRLLPRWAARMRHAVSIPGFDPRETPEVRPAPRGDALRLFYVGGVLPPVYDLEPLLRGLAAAVGAGGRYTLTICTREAEWPRRPAAYEPFLGPHVSVVHNRTRGELLDLYSRHDVAVMPFGTVNSDWAMPVKFPEAMGAGLPVLAGEGTAVGRRVAEEGTGWVVGRGEGGLAAVLAGIDAGALERARGAVRAAQPRYTWAERAREIAGLAREIAGLAQGPG